MYPKLFTSNTVGGIDGEVKGSFAQWAVQTGISGTLLAGVLNEFGNGMPVFDLYNNSGVSVNNTAQVASYFLDEVHPTPTSHEAISRRIDSFVLSL